MTQTASSSRSTDKKALFLPDFCTPDTVLAAVLISQLVALVLTLAQSSAGSEISFWLDLARTSLFLLWIGLSSAAVLCYGRPFLERFSQTAAATLALALLVATTGLISEFAWWLETYWDQFIQPPGQEAANAVHLAYLLRNMLICLVVSALALRYFYVLHQWRRNVELEASARVEALQARIRPHFLFNSMNTIAALTRSNPAQAEEAIEDLADLFRASLKESDQQITLKEELEIARLYQRIEQLRLGERLQVDWQVDGLPLRARIPGLSLQPLLENAIYHGIEPSPGGGTVTVRGTIRDEDMIEISISNPIPESRGPDRRQGNQMALTNIRDRFDIAWAGRATVEFGPGDGKFVVTLLFPNSGSSQ
jgi:two-component system sensor histidine kinase AlgZ